MEPLNSIGIDTQWGMRHFELLHADVTKLDFHVDLLMISVLTSDFSPLDGTVVGALSSNLGISVKRLSEEPELEFLIQPSSRLWVSKVVNPMRINRIMCLEIPYDDLNVSQIVEQAFRSLAMLEART